MDPGTVQGMVGARVRAVLRKHGLVPDCASDSTPPEAA